MGLKILFAIPAADYHSLAALGSLSFATPPPLGVSEVSPAYGWRTSPDFPGFALINIITCF